MKITLPKTPRSHHDIDVNAILEQNRQIALIWSIEDVQRLRPDLTDHQAWEVLKAFQADCDDNPDPMYQTMLELADMSYPTS